MASYPPHPTPTLVRLLDPLAQHLCGRFPFPRRTALTPGSVKLSASGGGGLWASASDLLTASAPTASCSSSAALCSNVLSVWSPAFYFMAMICSLHSQLIFQCLAPWALLSSHYCTCRALIWKESMEASLQVHQAPGFGGTVLLAEDRSWARALRQKPCRREVTVSSGLPSSDRLRGRQGEVVTAPTVIWKGLLGQAAHLSLIC